MRWWGRNGLLKAFEQELEGVKAGLHTFFEGCLPVEILAAGRESLAFGPMRPVGLTDPRTGKRPYVVLQLRGRITSPGLCTTSSDFRRT